MITRPIPMTRRELRELLLEMIRNGEGNTMAAEVVRWELEDAADDIRGPLASDKETMDEQRQRTT